MARRLFFCGLVLFVVVLGAAGFWRLGQNRREKLWRPFAEKVEAVYGGGRVSFFGIEGKKVYSVLAGRVSMGGGTARGENFNMVVLAGEGGSCRYLFKGASFFPKKERVEAGEALFEAGSEVFEGDGCGLVLECRDREGVVVELTEKSFRPG